jgi:hypothetical protein
MRGNGSKYQSFTIIKFELLNSFLIHEQWSIPYCFAD